MEIWPLSLLSKQRLVAAADAARDARDWKSAAKFYRRALNRDRRWGPIWVQYGHMLKEAGNLPGADAAYQRAVAIAPNADIHLQIGHLRKLQGDGEAALSSYERALEMDPLLRDAAEEIERLRHSRSDNAATSHRPDFPSHGGSHMEEMERRIGALGGQMSLFLEHVATTKALAFELAAITVRLDRIEADPRSKLENSGVVGDLSKRVEDLARRLDAIAPRLLPRPYRARAEGDDDGAPRA
jgi:tetratricopeptide (TPR) repeat protein